MMLRRIACLFCLLAAPMARAHPHVFVDVALTFETDAAGRIAAVEVSWTYDELFSLLVLTDKGLDPDGDMVLTSAERAALRGFDLADWPPGFEGALFIHSGDRKLDLGTPTPVSVDMADGRIVSRHRRTMEPAGPGVLIVRAYDPYFYASLHMSGETVLPDGCKGELVKADPEAAEAKLDELVGMDDEAVFDEARIGIYFADTLVLTCAAP